MMKAGALILLLVIFIFVVALDARSRFSNISETRAMLSELTKAVAMKDVLNTNADSINKNSLTLAKEFPQPSQLTDYLANLEKAAKNNHLEFTLQEPKDFSSAAGESIPFSFTISGSYKNSQNFFTALSTGFPAIQIQSVEFNRRSAGGYDVQVLGTLFLSK